MQAQRSNTFRELFDKGGVVLVDSTDAAIVAYRYGNSREDIYCAPCARRRNNLAAAIPILLDIAEAGELECSFCGDVI